jgi:hypothetical protein
LIERECELVHATPNLAFQSDIDFKFGAMVSWRGPMDVGDLVLDIRSLDFYSETTKDGSHHILGIDCRAHLVQVRFRHDVVPGALVHTNGSRDGFIWMIRWIIS